MNFYPNCTLIKTRAVCLHFAAKGVDVENTTCSVAHRQSANTARIDKALLGAVSPLGAWEPLGGTKARGFPKVHQFDGPHQQLHIGYVYSPN